MTIALNKPTLKKQRDQAKLYRRFLPSLKLKRQQLQAAWRKSREELADIEAEFSRVSEVLQSLYSLIGASTINVAEIGQWVRVANIEVGSENVVGTAIPCLRQFDLQVNEYSRLAMPFWLDSLIEALKEMVHLRVRLAIAQRRTELLGAALLRVTQRVNLFEKVLIPRAEETIRRIVVFLSDQERAAVVRSKIAKAR
jgi:V/A-type H+-transporting ATPase subunit D